MHATNAARRRVLIAMLAACAALGIAATGAGAMAVGDAPAGTTLIAGGETSLLGPLTVAHISSSFDSPQPFADAGSVSADGRYVAFTTNVVELGASSPLWEAVAVRDMSTGAIVFLTPASDVVDGVFTVADRYFAPSLSGDGQRVAYVAQPHSGAQQIWVHDLRSGTTSLVSRASDGTPGNAGSYSPTLDQDGSHVAFASQAWNLAAGDARPADASDTGDDVFVRTLDQSDLSQGTTVMASVGGDPAIHGGYVPVISADGEHVAFASDKAGIVPGASGLAPQAFVRDLRPSGSGLRMASVVGGTSVESDAGVGLLSLSADGSRVAFDSTATNLDPAVASGDFEVWVHDFADGSTILASRADGPNGAPVAGYGIGAVAPSLSADGSVVAFQADALNMDAPASSWDQVYRRDLDAGTTSLVSRAQGAAGAPARIGQTGPIFPDEATGARVITANGSCIVFNGGVDLPGDDALVRGDVFMRVVGAGCGPVSGDDDGSADDGSTDDGSDDKGSDDDGSHHSGHGGGERRHGGPAPDVTPPVLSAVSLTRARAAASGTGRPPRTVLRLKSSEAGTLTIAVGRGKQKQSIVLVRQVHAGRSRFVLVLRDGDVTLGRGRYRVTLVVRDAAGNTSKSLLRPLVVRG